MRFLTSFLLLQFFCFSISFCQIRTNFGITAGFYESGFNKEHFYLSENPETGSSLTTEIYSPVLNQTVGFFTEFSGQNLDFRFGIQTFSLKQSFQTRTFNGLGFDQPTKEEISILHLKMPFEFEYRFRFLRTTPFLYFSFAPSVALEGYWVSKRVNFNGDLEEEVKFPEDLNHDQFFMNIGGGFYLSPRLSVMVITDFSKLKKSENCGDPNSNSYINCFDFRKKYVLFQIQYRIMKKKNARFLHPKKS